MGFSAMSHSFMHLRVIFLVEHYGSLSSLLSSRDGPWLLAGAFNATLGAHEQCGACLPGSLSCVDFQKFIDDGGLHHVPSNGLFYSWARTSSTGHIERKLDTMLCNLSWLNAWSWSSYHVLPRTSY